MRTALPALSALFLAAPLACQSDAPAEDGGLRSSELGPNSTPGQLGLDAEPREPVFRFTNLQDALHPYFEFKKQLQKDHGLSFGIDYTALYQQMTDEVLGEDSAATGIFRIYGSWELIDRGGPNTGRIVFKGEDRHRLGTDVANQNLGFQAGYQGLVAAQFSDFGTGVTNLYWQQEFSDGRFNLIAGQVDVTDYFDVYALASPLMHFLNFDQLYPTAAPPNQGLGAAGSVWLSDNLYAIAGIADANGQPTELGFDTFFEDQEFFTHAEFGWTAGRDRFWFDNVHITGWHSDPRDSVGQPEGSGVLFSASTFVDETWLPFVRGGWSDGEASLLNKSLTVGAGYYVRGRGDVVAAMATWGDPSASALNDQVSTEVFYRVQMSPNFAITPDLQLLFDPAANPDEDLVAIFGVRGRLAF